MKKLLPWLSVIIPFVALIISAPNLYTAWYSLTDSYSTLWVIALFVVTVLFGVVLDTLLRNLFHLFK